jgi:multidrug efflux pump subunit AcrB
MAVPGALSASSDAGVSGTTINVMSLMGAIMTIGISVSNSILVVSFAKDCARRRASRRWRPSSKPARRGCVRS